MKDIDTLMKLKDSLENEATVTAVQNARVIDPVAEVEESLTSFITTQLQNIKRDAEFSDLVKLYIRQRLPEFTVDQLLSLNNQVEKNKNSSIQSILPLFTGEGNTKTIMDNLKSNKVENTAQNLYAKADKNVLQAITYLGAVLDKMSKKVDNIEVTPDSVTD